MKADVKEFGRKDISAFFKQTALIPKDFLSARIDLIMRKYENSSTLLHLELCNCKWLCVLAGIIQQMWSDGQHLHTLGKRLATDLSFPSMYPVAEHVLLLSSSGQVLRICALIACFGLAVHFLYLSVVTKNSHILT